MHADLHFMTNIVIILLTAGLGGYISKRLGQPQILGQIIGGIVIGPSVIGLVTSTTFIQHLSEIGVILLMFLAGLETDFEELKRSAGQSTSIALGGIILPFIMGFGVMYFLKAEFSLQEAVFVGVMLTATSMGITIQTLAELGNLRTKFGMSVLGAAIIDDVAGVVILAVVLGIFGGGTGGLVWLFAKISIFFLLMLLFGGIFSDGVKSNLKFLNKIKAKYILMASLFMALLFATIANEFGMSAIIGAYFIGLIISTTKLKHKVSEEVEKFGTGFFIPIFFINIGLGMDLSNIPSHFLLAISIAIVGILSKVIGSGIGAKLSGFDNRESLRVGISMVPRAEVALIMAKIGLTAGFIHTDAFTGIILLVVISSILTPILLKLTEKKSAEPKKSLKKKVAS